MYNYIRLNVYIVYIHKYVGLKNDYSLVFTENETINYKMTKVKQICETYYLI